MADGDGGNRREADPVPYDVIAGALRQGKVVPFLGAGASAAHRPPGADWKPGAEFCPRGDELAKHLAETGDFPDKKGTDDLMLVASYFEVEPADRTTLRDRLDSIFCANTLRPGPIHELLADCPNLPMIMTTNYDGLIEEAIETARSDADRPAALAPHVVVDLGEEEWVKVRQAGTDMYLGLRKNELRRLFQRAPGPIVFKIHGTAHNEDFGDDEEEEALRRYVLTADDYVRVLEKQIANMPPYLNTILETCDRYLFLGYGLGDWNVRVLLSRMPRRNRSWAIQHEPLKAERSIWGSQGVNLYHCDIDEFVENVRDALEKLEKAEQEQ